MFAADTSDICPQCLSKQPHATGILFCYEMFTVYLSFTFRVSEASSVAEVIHELIEAGVVRQTDRVRDVVVKFC